MLRVVHQICTPLSKIDSVFPVILSGDLAELIRTILVIAKRWPTVTPQPRSHSAWMNVLPATMPLEVGATNALTTATAVQTVTPARSVLLTID